MKTLKFLKRPNFQHLKELTLTENEVEVLGENTVWELSILKILDMEYNRIQVLKAKIFEQNTKLNKINFVAKSIDLLPKDWFSEGSIIVDYNIDNKYIESLNRITSSCGIPLRVCYSEFKFF